MALIITISGTIFGGVCTIISGICTVIGAVISRKDKKDSFPIINEPAPLYPPPPPHLSVMDPDADGPLTHPESPESPPSLASQSLALGFSQGPDTDFPKCYSRWVALLYSLVLL